MSQGLSLSRLVLEALHFVALGKGFLRYRNPRGTAPAAAARRSTSRPGVRQPRAWARPGGRWARGSARSCWATCARACSTTCRRSTTPSRWASCTTSRSRTASFGGGTPRPAARDVHTEGHRTRGGFLRATDGADCVVKPATGTGGGAGVATGIRTRWQLARAAAAAAVYSDELLIERQVEGDNYRLLYLDGELLDAYVREAPVRPRRRQVHVAALVRERTRSGWRKVRACRRHC